MPLKTHLIGVRLNNTELEKLTYLARANGITPSEALRRLIAFAQPEDLDLELRSDGLHRGAAREERGHG